MSRSRRQPLTSIRAVLAGLPPGDGSYFPKPAREPAARDLYLRLNGVAYQLWGAGQYRLHTAGGSIGVIRKP